MYIVTASLIMVLIQIVGHCPKAFDIESGSGEFKIEESDRRSSVTGRMCNDSSVRLVNGSAPSNGILEVCYGGTWGTVCNVSFTLRHGDVVCKQLGFFGVVRLTNEFGSGSSDTVWLSDLNCRGTESSLSDCTRVDFFSGPYGCQPCHHYRDVGIVCRAHEDACEHGAIRFTREYGQVGLSMLEGAVELCVDGLWGIMIISTNDHFNVGKVVCRQLGEYAFNDAFALSATNLFYFHSSFYSEIWRFNANCNGNESSLYDCDYQFISDSKSVLLQTDKYLYASCYDAIQLFTNSTTVVLDAGRIEEIVSFTCTASITDLLYYWTRNVEWFFEDFQLESNYYDYGYYRIISQYHSVVNISSTLQIISPRKSDEGRYHCLIGYTPVQHFASSAKFFEFVNQTHYLELKANLSINVSEGNSHTLISCELTGYIYSDMTDSVNVEWIRDGDPVQTSGQYKVTRSNNSMNVVITGEGIKVPSIISTLHIYTDEVAGTYGCNVSDGYSVLHQNITLEATSSVTTTPTPTTSTASIATGTAVGIAIGLTIFSLVCSILIIIIIILCVFQRKSKQTDQLVSRRHEILWDASFTDNQEKQSDKTKNLCRINTGIQREKLNELHLSSCVINSPDLKLMEKIGQGEFGVVYRGVYKKESTVMPVAIKTVKGLYLESQLVEDLFVEADKMKSLDHLHVLSLTGVCVGLLESPCIVMPFMSNGSLLSYLRREATDLTVNEMADENLINSVLKHLLSICLQVAKGMEYLAQQKLIHRDLAARNCMISSEGIIKIADFGLSEVVRYTEVYFKKTDQSSDKLPLKWMALESIHLGKYDEKTDVWSYGVLCWEVFNGGKTPYPGSTPREVVTMLDNGERLIRPTNAACMKEVYSIMMSCWENSPTCRPHFFELVENIDRLLVPLADYLDLASDYLKLN